MKRIAACLFVIFAYQWLFSQTGPINQHTYIYKPIKTTSPIVVDGELNEPAWQEANLATGFHMKWPNDTAMVKRKTIARLIYDKDFIYVSGECEDSTPHVVQSLKRDVGFYTSDLFAILLDPINQQSNGYVFAVNPLNVQVEDLVSSTNLNGPDFSWDNKWFSAVKRKPGKWVVEMAIPLKILRYTPNKTVWGVNFIRSDLKNYQYNMWAKIPPQFSPVDLGYTGALQWPEAPEKQRNNFVVSPYITGSFYDAPGSGNSEKSFDAGFDAKIALTSSLNLDATVNPDFSQIEVDQQQTNLTRFNIFFPERRTFFLENNDLFFNFGSTDYRPFYSRTIGLDSNGAPIPILAGVRMSGNVTKKLRLGVMNMQTRSTSDYKAQNYTAVALNQRLMSRSLFKAYLTNRQAFEKGKGASAVDYGRNLGGEFTFSNNSGSWQGWLAGNWSYKEGYKKDNHFYEAGANYSRRNFSTIVDLVNMGTNYYADMGFINRIENYDALRDTILRVGFKQAFNQTDYILRVNRKKIQYHQFQTQSTFTWNPNGSLNEAQNKLKYAINFTNTAEISATQTFNTVNLLFPFGITGGDPLPAGHYQFEQTELQYESDIRKLFTLKMAVSAGRFYNGHIKTIQGTANLRRQPWGNFSLNLQWNSLRFPAPYGNNELLLIQPKIEICFSNNLFWTTFIQYASQRNNFNINSRLQYRFKPMSDLYLVYTDNYFTDPLLKNKNRAVVFKMNYWLNL